MAKVNLKVLINGVVLEKSQATLELFRDLATIQNPGADTPYNALTNVKGKDGQNIPADVVLATVEAFGEASDVIEISENDAITGKTTFGKLVKYARFCLDRDSWKPETFGVKKVKETSTGFDL